MPVSNEFERGKEEGIRLSFFWSISCVHPVQSLPVEREDLSLLLSLLLSYIRVHCKQRCDLTRLVSYSLLLANQGKKKKERKNEKIPSVMLSPTLHNKINIGNKKCGICFAVRFQVLFSSSSILICFGALQFQTYRKTYILSYYLPYSILLPASLNNCGQYKESWGSLPLNKRFVCHY